MSSVTTEAMSEVPLVDLEPLRSGDPDARKEVARVVANACRNLGFFYLKNHGVLESQVQGMFNLAHDFFSLPEDAKMEVAITKNPNFRGYLSANTKGNATDIKKNLQEAFQIYGELPAGDPDLTSGKPLHGPNPWPSAMPSLKPQMLAYYDTMTALSQELLVLFALGLDLPENAFRSKFTKPMNWLRLLHYPPQAKIDPEEAIGTRAHTDSSAMTILALDDVAGLQVFSTDEQWIPVKRIPGTFVVNTGEIMKVWTNGIFLSARHRVINWTGQERYSVPFFVTPNFEENLRPMLKHPDPNYVAPKFHPLLDANSEILCGEFLQEQYTRIYPTA